MEEEQTHACRLLAILAQAVPTHGRFKELQVRRRGRSARQEGTVCQAGNSCICGRHGGTGPKEKVLVHNPLPWLHLTDRSTGRQHAFICVCARRLVSTWVCGPACPPQVVSALLPLLRGGRSQMVSEHAASVVAVLAQNPDLHFHIVGCGAVPAMMPLLFSGGHALQARLIRSCHTHGFPHRGSVSACGSPLSAEPSLTCTLALARVRAFRSTGTDKTRTYVMASLMLLVDHEERHASVVARAGAIPALINLARGQAAGAAASAPGSGNGSGVGALVASAAVGGGKRSAEGTTTAAAGGASAAQQQAQQRGTAVQEFAVAVLCSLSRYVDIQVRVQGWASALVLVQGRCISGLGDFLPQMRIVCPGLIGMLPSAKRSVHRLPC